MQAQGAVSYHVRETLRAAESSSEAPSGIQLPPTVVRPRGLTPGHRRGRSAAKAYHLDLMKTILSSSLALALVSSATFANDSTWASLDQEIAGLSSSLTAQDASSGPKIGGWITATLNQQDGGAAGGADELGFGFWKIRLEATGNVTSDYSYKLSFDFSDTNPANDGKANLKDAFIKGKLAESFDLQMGRFKNPTLRSVLISDNKLLFVKRTLIGQAFDDRYTGAMLTGKFDMLTANVAAQNSGSNHTENFKYTVRGEAHIMGKGAGSVEGAYGAGDTNNMMVAGFYQTDEDLDKGDAWGVEAYLTMGAFAVSGEIAQLGEGLPYGGDVLKDTSFGPDSMPWDVTASFMMSDNWEVAVRYEDLDTTSNLTQASGGLSYYVNGHNMKWGVIYVMQDSDTIGGAEEDALILETTIAF